MWHSHAQPSSIAAALQSIRRCRSIKLISVRAWRFPTGGAELVAYFRDYQRLIDHWRMVLPADRFIEVDYEDLTRAPEPVIRPIIAACGLAWDNACLRPESNPRAVNTPSKWPAREPLYRTSAAPRA